MNRVFTCQLLAVLAASALNAQVAVKLSFSGNGGPSPINLMQPNTVTTEEDVAGSGSLGLFTYRNITAQTTAPQPSSTCSGPNMFYLARVAGAGIFRFQDGSLLTVSLVQGGDCIDLAAQQAHCNLTLQITGGTGRFQNASGSLTYTEIGAPVLADTSGNVVFATETGQITGNISRAGTTEDAPQ
ncbi:MAG: hypothetical protein JO323_15275 [Acidobacteriia bacterium]|nr:hypothetical protein [Terriglobia bacterium]